MRIRLMSFVELRKEPEATRVFVQGRRTKVCEFFAGQKLLVKKVFEQLEDS